MHPRVRATLLVGAALVALAPSSVAAAQAAHSVPAIYHAVGGRALTWKVVPSPSRGRHGNELLGVTCLSATSCTAVGSGGNKTLVENWNGTAWSIVPSPSRGGFSELRGVSCVSASACTAVGTWAPSASSPDQWKTLAETWNGSTWSIVPSPSPHSAQGQDILSGVSCVTAAFCAAVGSYGQSGSDEPLTFIWNGSTWSAAPSPKTGDDGVLESVSCVSATTCTAVGGEYQASISETWNGHAWSLVRGPDRNANPNLSGVSCASASACIAVGWYTDLALPAAPNRTLAESWNGSTWSVVHSPNPKGANASSLLAGLSCASPRACIAVGFTSLGSITSSGPLIEAWNGSKWSGVIGVGTGTAGAVLYSVSCPSATMCMAAGVGYTSSSADSGQTLTELGTSG